MAGHELDHLHSARQDHPRPEEQPADPFEDKGVNWHLTALRVLMPLVSATCRLQYRSIEDSVAALHDLIKGAEELTLRTLVAMESGVGQIGNSERWVVRKVLAMSASLVADTFVRDGGELFRTEQLASLQKDCLEAALQMDPDLKGGLAADEEWQDREAELVMLSTALNATVAMVSEVEQFSFFMTKRAALEYAQAQIIEGAQVLFRVSGYSGLSDSSKLVVWQASVEHSAKLFKECYKSVASAQCVRVLEGDQSKDMERPLDELSEMFASQISIITMASKASIRLVQDIMSADLGVRLSDRFGPQEEPEKKSKGPAL